MLSHSGSLNSYEVGHRDGTVPGCRPFFLEGHLYRRHDHPSLVLTWVHRPVGLGETGLLSVAGSLGGVVGRLSSLSPFAPFSLPAAAGGAGAGEGGSGRADGSTGGADFGLASAVRSPLGRIGRRKAASSRCAMSASLASGVSGGVRATVVGSPLLSPEGTGAAEGTSGAGDRNVGSRRSLRTGGWEGAAISLRELGAACRLGSSRGGRVSVPSGRASSGGGAGRNGRAGPAAPAEVDSGCDRNGGWPDHPSSPTAGRGGRAAGSATGVSARGSGAPGDRLGASRAGATGTARTIFCSITTSLGPPIISRCSRLSRRISTSRRRPSTAAASITASRG
jgi:hypothetical protein